MWQNSLYSRRLSEKNRVKAGGWLAVLLALVFALGAGARAFAYSPAVPPLPNPIADAPAATLLLPNFTVDLVNPNGMDTIFTIVNASPDPQVAHVVFWSDLSVEVLDFDVYLTGYGLYRLDLQTLLTTGVTPPTGPGGISHIGSLSEVPAPLIVSTCQNFLPLPPVPATQLIGVQQALTGQSSIELGGACAGTPQTDHVARGYITIDDVSQCNVLTFPGDDGYYGSPDGRGRIVTDNNVLWGDEFHINPSANKAYSQNLVHILANPNTGRPSGFAPGDYTFYGRYDFSAYSNISTPAPGAKAWQAYDHREPLPTTFLTRYVNPNSPQGIQFFNSGTTEIVWRDSKVDQHPFACSASQGNPPWFGLPAEGIAIFDEQEDVISPPFCRFSPCPPVAVSGFPAETQQTMVGGTLFPTAPFTAGWLWMDLNHVNLIGSLPGLNDPLEASSWVYYSAAKTSANALQSFRIAQRGIQLDTGNAPNHCVPDVPGGNVCNDQD
jgi:hypothetical protein